MLRAFISYRRGPSTPYARQIYDELNQRFGSERVFYDIDTLEPGTDFIDVIERHIDQSGLMLVIIDPTWSGVTNLDGSKRLLDDEDPVRMEVSRAIASELKVIPVLVGQAKMPGADDLPEDLKKLPRLHAQELSDTRWRADMEILVKRVATAIGIEKVPPPRNASSSPAQTKSRRNLIIAGAAALAVVAAIAIGVFALSGSDGDSGGVSSADSIQLSADTISLAQDLRRNTAALTTSISQGSDTSMQVSAFEDDGRSATDLTEQVSANLGPDDPGSAGLESGAQGLSDASASLETVAKNPSSGKAPKMAEAAREGMDVGLAGLEDALTELRTTLVGEGDAREAAVSSSLDQLDANRALLAATFDGLIVAVGP